MCFVSFCDIMGNMGKLHQLLVDVARDEYWVEAGSQLALPVKFNHKLPVKNAVINLSHQHKVQIYYNQQI